MWEVALLSYKDNNSNCLLEKYVVTAVCLCETILCTDKRCKWHSFIEMQTFSVAIPIQ